MSPHLVAPPSVPRGTSIPSPLPTEKKSDHHKGQGGKATLPPNAENTCKSHGKIEAPKDTSPLSKKGEASVTTGLLGLGKIMSPRRSNPSEILGNGKTLANDKASPDSNDSLVKSDSETWKRWSYPGSAP